MFRQYLPKVHWQAIETGVTGRGVPDINGCWNGREAWVECKGARGTRLDIVHVSPEQVGWCEARTRAGGRVFLAVRRRGSMTNAVDELLLYRGSALRLFIDGQRLTDVVSLVSCGGGPARWDWPRVAAHLFIAE
jgi:hypothetical protein